MRPVRQSVTLSLALALALALAAAVAPPATAAEAQAHASAEPDLPRGAFGESIEVRLIDVEVVVTDRRGNRVPGLTRDDFRLRVDGEEVPIAFFDEVRDGAYATGTEVADGEPAAVPANATPARPARINYLLFVDEYFLRIPHRNRVLARLAKQIVLGPEDRFAAVAFDGRRLGVLTGWTRSPQRVHDVLVAASRRSGRQALLDRLGRGGSPEMGAVGREGLALSWTDQLRRTLGALSTSLRSFADVPGRRVALVLAGGWPYEQDRGIPSLDFEDDDQPRLPSRSLLLDMQRDVEAVADVANATGFTLYPIDGPGAEAEGPGAGSREIGDVATAEHAIRGASEERTLMELAERTGGVAVLDGESWFVPMEKVREDTRTYYSLTFEHHRRGDGELRPIRVEVDRSGLRVRSRESFLDVSPGTEAELRRERALLLGPDAGPRLVVEVAPPSRAGKHMQVPFVVHLPVDEVSLEPVGDGGGRTDLGLQVIAEQADGKRSDLVERRIDLDLDAEWLTAGSVAWEATVRLRRQPQTLVFVLVDERTSRTWIARKEVVPEG